MATNNTQNPICHISPSTTLTPFQHPPYPPLIGHGASSSVTHTSSLAIPSPTLLGNFGVKFHEIDRQMRNPVYQTCDLSEGMTGGSGNGVSDMLVFGEFHRGTGRVFCGDAWRTEGDRGLGGGACISQGRSSSTKLDRSASYLPLSFLPPKQEARIYHMLPNSRSTNTTPRVGRLHPDHAPAFTRHPHL